MVFWNFGRIYGEILGEESGNFWGDCKNENIAKTY